MKRFFFKSILTRRNNARNFGHKAVRHCPLPIYHVCIRRQWCVTLCDRTRFTKIVIRVVPAVVSSLCVVAGLQRMLSFPANSELVCVKSFLPSMYSYANFYSYSRIGNNKNNMKIRMWTAVLLSTIRKARNHCQDVDHCQGEDHCQYHLGIDTVDWKLLTG